MGLQLPGKPEARPDAGKGWWAAVGSQGLPPARYPKWRSQRDWSSVESATEGKTVKAMPVHYLII